MQDYINTARRPTERYREGPGREKGNGEGRDRERKKEIFFACQQWMRTLEENCVFPANGWLHGVCGGLHNVHLQPTGDNGVK